MFAIMMPECIWPCYTIGLPANPNSFKDSPNRINLQKRLANIKDWTEPMWTGLHQFFAVTRLVIIGYSLNQSSRSKIIYINYLPVIHIYNTCNAYSVFSFISHSSYIGEWQYFCMKMLYEIQSQFIDW